MKELWQISWASAVIVGVYLSSTTRTCFGEDREHVSNRPIKYPPVCGNVLDGITKAYGQHESQIQEMAKIIESLSSEDYFTLIVCTKLTAFRQDYVRRFNLKLPGDITPSHRTGHESENSRDHGVQPQKNEPKSTAWMDAKSHARMGPIPQLLQTVLGSMNNPERVVRWAVVLMEENGKSPEPILREVLRVLNTSRALLAHVNGFLHSIATGDKHRDAVTEMAKILGMYTEESNHSGTVLKDIVSPVLATDKGIVNNRMKKIDAKLNRHNNGDGGALKALLGAVSLSDRTSLADQMTSSFNLKADVKNDINNFLYETLLPLLASKVGDFFKNASSTFPYQYSREENTKDRSMEKINIDRLQQTGPTTAKQAQLVESNYAQQTPSKNRPDHYIFIQIKKSPSKTTTDARKIESKQIPHNKDRLHDHIFMSSENRSTESRNGFKSTSARSTYSTHNYSAILERQINKQSHQVSDKLMLSTPTTLQPVEGNSKEASVTQPYITMSKETQKEVTKLSIRTLVQETLSEAISMTVRPEEFLTDEGRTKTEGLNTKEAQKYTKQISGGLTNYQSGEVTSAKIGEKYTEKESIQMSGQQISKGSKPFPGELASSVEESTSYKELKAETAVSKNPKLSTSSLSTSSSSSLQPGLLPPGVYVCLPVTFPGLAKFGYQPVQNSPRCYMLSKITGSVQIIQTLARTLRSLFSLFCKLHLISCRGNPHLHRLMPAVKRKKTPSIAFLQYNFKPNVAVTFNTVFKNKYRVSQKVFRRPRF